jgi:signal transduction histidine kinase
VFRHGVCDSAATSIVDASIAYLRQAAWTSLHESLCQRYALADGPFVVCPQSRATEPADGYGGVPSSKRSLTDPASCRTHVIDCSGLFLTREGSVFGRNVTPEHSKFSPGHQCTGQPQWGQRCARIYTQPQRALRMKRDWSKFWQSAAQWFLRGAGLVLVNFVCLRLGQDIHVAAFGSLILVVLTALRGDFIGSVLLGIAAAGCLDYFFAPHLFSFRTDNLEDTITIAAFLTISFLASGLVIQRNRAEEKLRNAQADLAHVARVTTIGELTASIAHEVNQPLAAVVTNAETCLRWLARETPDLDEARRAAESIIKDGMRAVEVIRHVRALSRGADVQKTPLDINDVVNEAVSLVKREVLSHGVSLRIELAPVLPMVLADRVQLQQVLINLVMNGIEAMQPVTDRPRELVIRSQQDGADRALVTVKDCGIGISAENSDRLFKAFFTTKSGGMGMGLSICRSIIEAHGGRLSASGNVGPGAEFQFVLPAYNRERAR